MKLCKLYVPFFSRTLQMEQITAEYRLRARELHPDKNKGEEVEVTDQFKRLQEAKETLTDPNRRADYDKWRTSGLAISWKEWKAMKGKTHAVRYLLAADTFIFQITTTRFRT